MFYSPRPSLSLLLCAVLLLGGVAACDSGGGGEEPEREPDTSPPGVPLGLEGRVSDGGVVLEWSDSSADDLAGYNVYRAEERFYNIADAQHLNADGLVEEESYRDEAVRMGTTYFYRVTSVDTASNESTTSTDVAATVFPAPPEEPSVR